MRSGRRAIRDQGELPLGLPDAAAPGAVRRPVRHDPDGLVRVRIGGELAAARGWPAGTEVLVDPGRRPQRGDVVVVRAGEGFRAGVLERRFGRSVLCSDRGAAWVGPGVEVVGVVTVVGATLDGMPGSRGVTG